MVLSDFVAAARTINKSIGEAEVVALRLYTTAAYVSMNGPLREKETAKWWPVTLSSW